MWRGARRTLESGADTRRWAGRPHRCLARRTSATRARWGAPARTLYSGRGHSGEAARRVACPARALQGTATAPRRRGAEHAEAPSAEDQVLEVPECSFERGAPPQTRRTGRQSEESGEGKPAALAVDEVMQAAWQRKEGVRMGGSPGIPSQRLTGGVKTALQGLWADCDVQQTNHDGGPSRFFFLSS